MSDKHIPSTRCLPWVGAEGGDVERGMRWAREHAGKPYWPVEMDCGCKLWPDGVEPNPDCDVDAKFPWHDWRKPR